jgi:hypothetical protein
VVLLGVSGHLVRKKGPGHITLGLRVLNIEVPHSGTVSSEEASMDSYSHFRDRFIRMFGDNGKISLTHERGSKDCKREFHFERRGLRYGKV